MTAGVWQGDALSLVLFNLALESVVWDVLKSKPHGFTIGQDKQIILTAYLDDIAIILEWEENLKGKTKQWINAVKNIKFINSKNKTKFNK